MTELVQPPIRPRPKSTSPCRGRNLVSNTHHARHKTPERKTLISGAKEVILVGILANSERANDPNTSAAPLERSRLGLG